MGFLMGTAFAAETATTAASTTAAAPQNAGLSSIIMLVVFAAFIYFILWRPQNRRMKQHRDLVSGLKSGDEVVTSGGIIGKIVSVEETFLRVRIADNTEVKMQKNAVATVLPKGTIKEKA